MGLLLGFSLFQLSDILNSVLNKKIGRMTAETNDRVVSWVGAGEEVRFMPATYREQQCMQYTNGF